MPSNTPQKKSDPKVDSKFLTCITCKSRINRNRTDYIAVKNHPGYCYCKTCVDATKKLGNPHARVP